MFTVEQIKEAHEKVKMGADFPRYIQEIKKLGLLKYEFWVKDGRTTYYGDAGYEVEAEAIYFPMEITSPSSAIQLMHNISLHQLGQTDFLTFCRQAADTGVEKWEVDTQKMLCTYYDLQGQVMVSEVIPLSEHY